MEGVKSCNLCKVSAPESRLVPIHSVYLYPADQYLCPNCCADLIKWWFNKKYINIGMPGHDDKIIEIWVDEVIGKLIHSFKEG